MSVSTADYQSILPWFEFPLSKIALAVKNTTAHFSDAVLFLPLLGNYHYEKEYLGGMDQRRHHDTAPMGATAMAMAANLGYQHFATAKTEERKRAIDNKTRRQCKNDFQANDFCKHHKGYTLGNKNRQQLVACRKKNGQKRSERHHASGVKARGGGGNSALRDCAGKRANGRPHRTRAPENSPERASRMRFHRLKDKIRRKKERQQRKGFFDEIYHSAEIASHGHCAAQAPQSTHFSASIV